MEVTVHAPHDSHLTDLQSRWAGKWKIWQARRDGGAAGDLVASRMDDTSGPWPTVIADSADELDRLLTDQAERAARGERQPQP
jgi:hypothetical protein